MFIEISDLEKAVIDSIKKRTREHKIIGGQILEEIGMIDPNMSKPGATLRKVINSLRQKGFAICSDSSGYWYAQTKGELEETIESLKGRAKKIYEAAAGMQKAVTMWDDVQQKLF